MADNQNTAQTSASEQQTEQKKTKKGGRSPNQKHWTMSALLVKHEGEPVDLEDLIREQCDPLIQMMAGNKKGEATSKLNEAIETIVSAIKVEQAMLPANAPSEAEEAFEKKFGVKPNVTSPAQYVVKQKTESRAITIEINQRRVSGVQFDGVFQGFRLQLPGLKGCKISGREYADNELAIPFIVGPVNPDEKPAALKLKDNQVLRLADCQDVTVDGVPLEEWQASQASA